MRIEQFLIILLCLLSISAFAQKRRLGDFGFFSIERPFPVKEPKKIVPVFHFDGQNMFIGSRSVRLGGVKAGVEHTPTGIRAGLGFYAFTNRLISENVFVPEAGFHTNVETDFGLMNLFVEPRVFESRRFRVSIPVTIGYGAIEQYYTTSIGSLRPYGKSSLTAFSALVNAEFNVFYWLGLGAGLGYHHFGTSDNQVQRRYSGFVYNIKLKIDIIDIYKTYMYQINR